MTKQQDRYWRPTIEVWESLAFAEFVLFEIVSSTPLEFNYVCPSKVGKRSHFNSKTNTIHIHMEDTVRYWNGCGGEYEMVKRRVKGTSYDRSGYTGVHWLVAHEVAHAMDFNRIMNHPWKDEETKMKQVKRMTEGEAFVNCLNEIMRRFPAKRLAEEFLKE